MTGLGPAVLYGASPGRPLAALAIGYSVAGVGTLGADAAANLMVGHHSDAGGPSPTRCEVARLQLWNVVLTAAEFRKQYLERNILVRRSACVLNADYLGSTGRTIDRSGAGNHGTVTSPLVTPHPAELLPRRPRRQVRGVAAVVGPKVNSLLLAGVGR
jgi:hypothetical protein